jgi:MFS family permease
MPDGSRPEPTLRSLGLSVYVPTFLFALGQGAVMPIVPLVARDLGASLAFAGLVVALRGLGILAFDIPAGWLVTRLGERLAMAVGTGIVAVSLVGAIWSPSAIHFAVFTFLMGCGWSVWLLARLSYVTELMPVHLRGRALSTLGGINRVGSFAGPFLGVLLSGQMGMGLDGYYYLHIVTALAASAMLVFLVRGEDGGTGAVPAHQRVNFAAIVREHSSVFLTAGFGVTAIGALRATRMQVLPLWASQMGLDDTQVSVISGLSTGLEALLFYPAGSAMDRFGRKSVALPCLVLMAVGMLLLPLTQGFGSILLVGLLIGLGNGLGSGIVMTLGADFSPTLGRAQFLGAWRMCSDLGIAGGPLLVAAVIRSASLGASSLLMGVLGLVGACLMLVWMPETLQRPARSRPASEGSSTL